MSERDEPETYPHLPPDDQAPMSPHLFGYALVEVLILARDIDLWMRVQELAQEAAAVAKQRIEAEPKDAFGTEPQANGS